jgi:hypothetical protein
MLMGERVAQEFIEYKLDTPFGTILIAPTTGGYLFVKGDPIRVFNIDYRISLRMEIREGGWHVCTEAGLYMRRTVQAGEASAAAERKFQDVVIPLIVAWAEGHPSALWRGQAISMNNQICRLDEHLAEMEESLRVTRIKRRDLHQQEAEALKRVEEFNAQV